MQDLLTSPDLASFHATLDACDNVTWAEAARAVSRLLDAMPVGTVIGSDAKGLDIRYVKEKTDGLGWHYRNYITRVNRRGRRVDESVRAWGGSWNMALVATHPSERRDTMRAEIIAAAWSQLEAQRTGTALPAGDVVEAEAETYTPPAQAAKFAATLGDHPDFADLMDEVRAMLNGQPQACRMNLGYQMDLLVGHSAVKLERVDRQSQIIGMSDGKCQTRCGHGADLKQIRALLEGWLQINRDHLATRAAEIGAILANGPFVVLPEKSFAQVRDALANRPALVALDRDGGLYLRTATAHALHITRTEAGEAAITSEICAKGTVWTGSCASHGRAAKTARDWLAMQPEAVAMPEAEEGRALVPAVPVAESVTPRYLVCLEDGQQLKMLKRHLKNAYDMTPDEYRAKWGLPAHYPMVAPAFAALPEGVTPELYCATWQEGEPKAVKTPKPRAAKKAKPAPKPSREEKAAALAAEMPDDEAGLLVVARGAVDAYHAAVMAGDDAALDLARETYDAVVFKLNDGTFFGSYGSDEAPGKRIAAYCAAPAGEVPLWGQGGRFVADIGTVRAVVVYKGFGGVSLSDAGFDFHAIDLDKPFISETGYRSDYTNLAAGKTVADMAAAVLARYAAEKGKGKGLVAIDTKDRPWMLERQVLHGLAITPAEAAPVETPAAPVASKKRQPKAEKPKQRAILSLEWRFSSNPVPAGVDTLDGGKSIWACTVLDRAYEREIQAQAPAYQFGTGWAMCWGAITEEPKRWAPERKAATRRRNLRKRLDKKFPLFANLFEAQEIERRPAYFDPQAIDAGGDMAPVPAVPEPARRRLGRWQRPEGRFEQLNMFDRFGQAERFQTRAEAQGRHIAGLTVAAVCRQLTRKRGRLVTPEDLGQAPFDIIDLSAVPADFLGRRKAPRYAGLDTMH